MNRTITVHFVRDDVIDVVPPHAFDAALGYLATWAMTQSSKYDKCDMYLSYDKMDITAVYTSSEHANARYIIGAIFHDGEKRYSFHS